MSREQIPVPTIDASAMVKDLDRITKQIDELEVRLRAALRIEYGKVNMDPLFEGGGFFAKRDRAALDALMKVQREAFFAGFKRSDQPGPSEARLEAAYQEWAKRR